MKECDAHDVAQKALARAFQTIFSPSFFREWKKLLHDKEAQNWESMVEIKKQEGVRASLLKHISYCGAVKVTTRLPKKYWTCLYFEESSGEFYLDIGNHWYGKLLTELVGESVVSELNDASKGDVVESLFGWWWLCEQHFRARGLVLDDRALDLLKLLNDYFLHGYLAYTKDDPC